MTSRNDSATDQVVLAAINALKDVLATAKQDFRDDPAAFTNSKIFRMARYINLMSELLVNLGQPAANNSVLECALEDLDIELEPFFFDKFKRSWDEFLGQVEESSFQVSVSLYFLQSPLRDINMNISPRRWPTR